MSQNKDQGAYLFCTHFKQVTHRPTFGILCGMASITTACMPDEMAGTYRPWVDSRHNVVVESVRVGKFFVCERKLLGLGLLGLLLLGLRAMKKLVRDELAHQPEDYI